MIYAKKNAAEKRVELRQKLASGKLLQFPGAFSPLVAKLIEEAAFEGVYISGAVLSADLCLPDIGLTTLTEVARRGSEISRITNLPSIIDADTGFGEPINAARTVQQLEECGISGCHFEDQQNPKRCGHLDHKLLVSEDEMQKKLKAASEMRRDSNFLIIARTDARGVDGLEAAISRAKLYVDSGADVIFPEALQNEKEFEQFRKEVKVPLLANMTEFGKSKLLSKDELDNLGYNIVIYPVTTLRLAMHATDLGLRQLRETGSQKTLLDKMQTRTQLYELLSYKDYNQFDTNIFNFKL